MKYINFFSFEPHACVLLQLVIFFTGSIKCAPLDTTLINHSRFETAEQYLAHYGYFDKNTSLDSTNGEEKFRVALMQFQTFANIKISGEVDVATQQAMRLPRCGVSDVHEVHNGHSIHKHSRKKRYVLEGSRWKVRKLSYNISRYPNTLDVEHVEGEIRSAFTAWELHTNLAFRRVTDPTDKVHIDIRFESGQHGTCDEVFDGKGKTTAHAYFPRNGGAIHFDADEEWTVNSIDGINLFQVATHEIGHALGLDHTTQDIPYAVMSPFYTKYEPKFALHADDIRAIQALYGKKSYLLCEDPSVDAVTIMADGFYYIFKGPYVYKMNNFQKSEISDGYPKAISFEFPNLPSEGIDTVLTRSNNITYFFKGDKFWRLSNMTMDAGFPKNISEYFQGIPSNLDAAMTLSSDDQIVFFKGTQYWKFEHLKNPPVSKEYPQSLATWKGIPQNGIDAVVPITDTIHGTFILFIRQNQFWRFNQMTHTVEVADPPYPRPTSFWLYGCSR